MLDDLHRDPRRPPAQPGDDRRRRPRLLHVGRVLGRSRSLCRHRPSQASAPPTVEHSFGMCSFVPWRSSCARADLAAKSGVATGNGVRRPHTDPADLVRPRALSCAVSRSPEPMRRANQPEEVSAVPRPAAATWPKLISTVILSRASCSTPGVEGAGKSTARSVGARKCVEFGPNSALSAQSIHNAELAGVVPNLRGPFRSQFRAGLNYTLEDYLSRLRSV